jgi:hypothetical protein
MAIYAAEIVGMCEVCGYEDSLYVVDGSFVEAELLCGECMAEIAETESYSGY